MGSQMEEFGGPAQVGTAVLARRGGFWHQLVAACPGDGTHGSCLPCRTQSQADRDSQRGEESQADAAQLAEAARVL